MAKKIFEKKREKFDMTHAYFKPNVMLELAKSISMLNLMNKKKSHYTLFN